LLITCESINQREGRAEIRKTLLVNTPPRTKKKWKLVEKWVGKKFTESVLDMVEGDFVSLEIVEKEEQMDKYGIQYNQV
jgi:hypothetical protein